MVLIQIRDNNDEMQDLWLSEKHEGARREDITRGRLYEGLLRGVPLFAKLEANELSFLADSLQRTEYPPGECVIKQGDVGDKFFMVVSGSAEVEIEKPGMDPIVVNTYKDAGFFGEAALLNDAPRGATIRATSRLILVYLDRDTFDLLINIHPTIGEKLADLSKVYNRGATLDETENVQPHVAHLAKIPVFSFLEKEERAVVADIMRHEPYRNGDFVIRAGHEFSEMFIVDQGQLVVEKKIIGGKHQVGQYKPGDAFGMLGVVRGTDRLDVDVKAMQTSVCVVLRHAELNRILDANPDIDEKVGKVIEAYNSHKKTREQEEVIELASRTALLSGVPLFAPLSPKQRAYVASKLHREEHEDGTLIVKQGEVGEKFYVLEKGKASVEVTASTGDAPKRVATLVEGNVFGEQAVLMKETRKATVKSLGVTVTLGLDQETFHDILSSNEQINAAMQDKVDSYNMASQMAGATGSAAAAQDSMMTMSMKPVPSIIPLKDQSAVVHMDGTVTMKMLSRFGTPTIFARRPTPDLICSICGDVFLDPYVATDGITYCRDCIPEAVEKGADIEEVGPETTIWRRILETEILCHHAVEKDTSTNAKQWNLDRGGCEAQVRLEEREQHEDYCSFAKITCTLPDVGSQLIDMCGKTVRRGELAQHRSQCDHRLVNCQHHGCTALVQVRKKARHEALCPHGPAECPFGCGWKGLRGQLTKHRSVCGHVKVTCGREMIGVEVGEGTLMCCTFTTTRRHLAMHESTCQYRVERCKYCSRLFNVAHLRDHLKQCEERGEKCTVCGVEVPRTRMEVHKAHKPSCKDVDKVKCPYFKFGCQEEALPGEMEVHIKAQAHVHLRTIFNHLEQMLFDYNHSRGQVNQVREKLLGDVKEAASHVEETMKIMSDGEAIALETIDKMKHQVQTSREWHAAEVAEASERVRYVKVNGLRQIKDLHAEGAALRAEIAKRLTKPEAVQIIEKLDRIQTDFVWERKETRRHLEAHKLQFTADVARVREKKRLLLEDLEQKVERLNKVVDDHKWEREVKKENVTGKATSIWGEFELDMQANSYVHSKLIERLERVAGRLAGGTMGVAAFKAEGQGYQDTFKTPN